MCIIPLLPCTPIFISLAWMLFKLSQGLDFPDGRRLSLFRFQTVSYQNDYVIIYAAVVVFVATHVCLRIQLLKHSSYIRTNTANRVAIFEGSHIRYDKAPFGLLFDRIT